MVRSLARKGAAMHHRIGAAHDQERYRSGRNGGASKASCPVRGTWVRIPPSPPFDPPPLAFGERRLRERSALAKSAS